MQASASFCDKEEKDVSLGTLSADIDRRSKGRERRKNEKLEEWSEGDGWELVQARYYFCHSTLTQKVSESHLFAADPRRV